MASMAYQNEIIEISVWRENEEKITSKYRKNNWRHQRKSGISENGIWRWHNGDSTA